VTFRYKDYRHDAQQKTMTLSAEEFIRRFLLHVLPAAVPGELVSAAVFDRKVQNSFESVDCVKLEFAQILDAHQTGGFSTPDGADHAQWPPTQPANDSCKPCPAEFVSCA
jgi:hypothetical protein